MSTAGGGGGDDRRRLDDALRVLRDDPVRLGKLLWPGVSFYREQRLIIQSVWENDETVVPAGHMLGKDFVTGFICLAFFLTRTPCRVLTTSVDGKQLEGVLWGEIRRFIQTCRLPLAAERGGPLIVNHLHIRKIVNGDTCGLSYLTGRVAAQGEGLSGHHIAQVGDGVPRTLAVVDEASGVDQVSFEKLPEWANRTLIIGNPYDCNNYFMWSVEGKPDGTDPGGDIPRDGTGPDGRPMDGYHRRVIHVPAEASPNVRLALEERRMGLLPSHKVLVPGVLPWDEYLKRERRWDDVKKTVGLRARFYRGTSNLMFPPAWLNKAEEVARRAAETWGRGRKAKAVGVDPAEGGDKTAMAAVDEYGLIELVSKKTPNTAVIRHEVIAFGERHGVPPEFWMFDRGGGGYQHADYLREAGYHVRTVGFGDGMTRDPATSGRAPEKLRDRITRREEKHAYVDRRAQMYGRLRELMDPAENPSGFGIPTEYFELRRQLALFPLIYVHGRMYLPPKHPRPGSKSRGIKSLVEIIGHSPDEADALIIALYCMENPPPGNKAGPGF